MTPNSKFAVIVPIYNNAGSIEELVTTIAGFSEDRGEPVAGIFVVDGSPDNSLSLLTKHLSTSMFPYVIVEHARNFGSFAAIRSGFAEANAEYLAVMAADLQEPPELVSKMFDALETGTADVVVGRREDRSDPYFTRLMATLFWGLYRRLVQRQLPKGGVDIFGCTAQVAQQLLVLGESNSSLVGQLYWVGFKRAEIAYRRLPRSGGGKSGWTFKKKLRYMSNSIFAFTDLPIRLLLGIGTIGTIGTTAVGMMLIVMRVAGVIDLAGYTPIMLAVLFTGALNLLGLGIVGSYVWRGYENTKGRPLAVVRSVKTRG